MYLYYISFDDYKKVRQFYNNYLHIFLKGYWVSLYKRTRNQCKNNTHNIQIVLTYT